MIDIWPDYEAWQGFWGYPSYSVPPLVGSHRGVTFPTTGLITRCRLALSANINDDWRTWNWFDISDRVRWQDGVTVVSGKRSRDPNVPASTAIFTVDNIDGELSRQNVFSSLYGLLFKRNPIWLTVDAGNGEFSEFYGYTQELPKQSDKSGTDGRIHMTCKGPLDHIFRSKEIESPLRVACEASEASFLWMLEEETTATQGASALSSGAAMEQVGEIAWASSTRVLGAKALPNMRSGSGTLVGSVAQEPLAGAPGYAFDHSYIVSIVVSPEDFSTGSWTVFRVSTENQNSISAWELSVVNDGTVQLISYDYSNVPTVRSTSAVVDGIFTDPKLLTFTGRLLDNTTGDAQFRILINNVEATTTTLTQFTGNLLTVALTASSASESAAVGCLMVHHLSTVSNGVLIDNVSEVPNGSEIVSALTGHNGDMVHERLARICRQRGIPFYTSAGSSQRLGPQPIDIPIEVLRDAEIVDGVVYELYFGLAYKSNAEYDRQPVSLALDIAQGHVVNDLTPIDDTTKFYNQWTVSRPGGSSSTQQKEGGISENEDVFPTQGTRNVWSDVQTAYLASYYANRDSSEADRWPNIKIALQKHPGLIATYQALPFGARMTVSNLRQRWGLTDLNLYIEGKEVFFNSKRYEVNFNASDADINNVGLLDDTQVLDARTLTLNGEITDTATILDVIAEDTLERLDTSPTHYPVDITIWGERITITNVDEICFDTLSRTEVATWGIADSLHPITTTGGAAGDYSVNGGTGKHLLTSVNVMRHSVYAMGNGLPANTYSNKEVYADVKIAVTPTGNSISAWLTSRFLDVNNYYDSVLLFDTSLRVQLALGVRAGGTHFLLTGGTLDLGPFTVGNFWRIYMRTFGNSISVKAWEVATQSEPSEFQITREADASVAVHPEGSDFSVQSRLEPGNTNVNPVVEWDNVHVVNPVHCDVTRSINGVVRSHTKGRSIRAAEPFILGL